VVQECLFLEIATFSDMGERYPHLFPVDKLVNFDIVAIVVDEQRLEVGPFIISKEFVQELKERVKLAEVKKGASIRVVGMNFNLSGEKLQEQKDLFDGLFLGSCDIRGSTRVLRVTWR
jgi:hypothetical protein